MARTLSESDSAHVAIAVVIPAAIVTFAILIAPHVTPSMRVAELVTFVGAASVACLGIAVGARRGIAGRSVLAVDVSVVILLAVIAIAHAKGLWLTPVIDAALIAFAWATGAAIGGRVEHPAHLLPAAAVASAADIASVASSWGPSNAIAASERALSLLAISFPVLGTRVVAPALGVGDLIFIALALGVARKHELPYRRIAALSFVGVLVAGFASALLERAVPALPAIGLAIVAFVPATRQVRRKDRGVTTIAIGVAVVIAAFAVLSAR
jgi:hypothetical protein